LREPTEPTTCGIWSPLRGDTGGTIRGSGRSIDFDAALHFVSVGQVQQTPSGEGIGLLCQVAHAPRQRPVELVLHDVSPTNTTDGCS
jgi:hypothetical protein